jgi:hypothetical protein
MKKLYAKMGLATVASKRVEYVMEENGKYIAYDFNANALGEVFPVSGLKNSRNYLNPVMEFKWDLEESYSFVAE